MATEHPSVCTLDCPDTCSLSVTVENGPHRQGPRLHVAALYRWRRSATRWRTTAPSSFTAPAACAIRCGASARAAPAGSSESPGQQALDSIHGSVMSVIDRWGPQAVMPLNYAGPHGLLSIDSMSLRFFHKLGATPAVSRLAVRRGAQRSLGWALTATLPGIGPELAAEAQAQCACGATTPPSPTCISCGRSARPSARAVGWR